MRSGRGEGRGSTTTCKQSTHTRLPPLPRRRTFATRGTRSTQTHLECALGAPQATLSSPVGESSPAKAHAPCTRGASRASRRHRVPGSPCPSRPALPAFACRGRTLFSGGPSPARGRARDDWPGPDSPRGERTGAGASGQRQLERVARWGQRRQWRMLLLLRTV